MKLNVNKIGLVVLLIGCIVLGVLLFKKKEKVITVKVPVEIEVPVPVIQKEFDTVYLPKPYAVKNPVNKELEEAFKESENKLALYRDAIKKRSYSETFEDSIQTITVHTTTQGKILDQAVSYKTKPRKIPVDTDVEVEIPARHKLFIGGEVGIPLTGEAQNKLISPTLKVQLMWQNKKDNIFSVGVDTRGNGWIGYNIKIRL